MTLKLARKTLFDGDTFEHAGRRYRVEFPADPDHPEPWNDGDGRGIVRDYQRGYESRDTLEQAGDVVLDTRDGPRYIFLRQATIEKAKAESWGGDPAAAADAELKRFRDWCHERWIYVGVVVTLLDGDDNPTSVSASLWGIESDDENYLTEVAHQLAEELKDTPIPPTIEEIAAALRPFVEADIMHGDVASVHPWVKARIAEAAAVLARFDGTRK